MKIKVFIAETDQKFCDLVINSLRVLYLNQLEIRLFSQANLLVETLKMYQPDVLLVSEDFVSLNLPAYERTKFAVLTAQQLKTCGGYPAICKYQQPEALFNEIKSLYAELGNESDDEDGLKAKVISFYGISGGVGASTLAVSFSKKLAKSGKSVLYLNLENFSSTSAFFNDEGAAVGTFDEVIRALKVRGMDFETKAESVLVKDSSGVQFFESESNFVDMLEFNKRDTAYLLENLQRMKRFEYIVVDGDFVLDGRTRAVFERSEQVVLVTAEDKISSLRLHQFIQQIATFEEIDQEHLDLLGKLAVVYNKSEQIEDELGVPVVGLVGKVSGSSTSDVAVNMEENIGFQQLFSTLQ